MEPGTSADIRPTRETTTADRDNQSVPPGPRQSRGIGARDPEEPEEESNIILGED
ncbi:MAG: hypothetical protein JF621_24250 [Streptomyces turgidiscabies]|nr:hypothetical protein [Streptomyces turgidiscabies]